MHLRISSRSREERDFRTRTSPDRMPRCIGTAGSVSSFCSEITLDDDSVTRRETLPIPETARCRESLSPPPTSASTTTAEEIKGQERNLRKYEGPLSHRSKEDGFRNRDDRTTHEIGRSVSPFRRMELLGSSCSHRDVPPKKPKISQRRRCTEPLSMAAREACLQDLGYLFDESKRTNLLTNRFSQLPEEDCCAAPSLPLVRLGSDESYSSMPLRMPVRKASMEDIRLGCSPCPQALLRPNRHDVQYLLTRSP